MSEKQLLDQKVLNQNGPLQRVRRWWKGILPGQGTITWGLTGWETVEEKERIIPAHTFLVATMSKAAV